MKAIAWMSMGLGALAITVCALTAQADVHPVIRASAAGLSSVGQATEASETASRREADKWLQQARKAMKEGNLELAEYYLQRAERLNVKYDALFARFQDTPAKVRRDLEKLQSKQTTQPKPDTSRSSAPAAPSDPYAQDAPASTADRLADDDKAKAMRELELGRAALRKGDTAGALAWYRKAASRKATFRPGEFSPAQLADELKKAGVSPEQLAVDDGGPLPPFQFRPMGENGSEPKRLPPIKPDGTTNAFPVVSNPDAEASGVNRPRATTAKAQALRLASQARAALDRGDLPTAQQLAQQAQQLRVPESAFAPGELRPWEVLLEVNAAMRRRQGVVQAGHVAQIPTSPTSGSSPVRQSLYDPQRDTTRNVTVQATDGQNMTAQQLYEQGLRALEGQDRATALERFRQAWQRQDELDPLVRQQLKDKLTLLNAADRQGSAVRPPSPLQEVTAQQELLRQKLFREIAAEQQAVEKMTPTDPNGALQRMEQLRQRVSQADLDPAARKQLLTYVDRGIQDLQTYIDHHRQEIELNERNREVLSDIEMDRKQKLEVQEKIAELIEQFNQLVDEERFAEAEVIADQVRELDPESPIARTLMIKSRLVSNIREQEWLRQEKEDGVYAALTSAEQSAIPFDDRNPMDFNGVQRWSELTSLRQQWLESQSRQLSPAEQEIQKALKQEVDVRFENQPLQDVLDTLGSMAGINIYPDPQGLAAEGVTSDTPVNINLSRPISLESALNLILEPLRLSYVIQNEVLLITSEQTRDAKVYPRVYNVADLVIPIPNFVQSYEMGLPAAIKAAHQAIGYGGTIQPVSMSAAPLMVASDPNQPASIASSVLAQTNGYGALPKQPGRPSQSPVGAPGAMGGAALADFDSLIELITSTIAPDSWQDVGGPGAIEPFPTNLSLVISQTQDVHDQIADLLKQLRRLQDLQVTIEVRFITLRDDFFERIGIDFDFDVDDNVEQLPRDDEGPSTIIGLDQDGLPTQDLDLSFTQGSFGTAVPAFGGFDATTAANFGFAILSDIEVFFLLQAAEGDVRSNVLQAPKVTLFNGQLASVNDTSQRPFVTSLIPVVGDFAAAHQPVIVVLSEGTSLSVQAVVSSDRRFVRLTLVPFFSQIGDVEEFTFSGSTTTNTGTNVVDPEGNPTGDINNAQTTTQGTTVQLPTFSFTTVSTTVSVPDGGTVLLGGIKRLREGRNEEGVPMLSKLPYVNRLFKNVGIGRETQSLMLMVTPRILIQEEEESKLGIEISP